MQDPILAIFGRKTTVWKSADTSRRAAWSCARDTANPKATINANLPAKLHFDVVVVTLPEF
jgi:hypothetical protein